MIKQQVETVQGKSGCRLNLLIIDDDNICLFLHRRIAELSLNFQSIRSALNGQKALDIINQTSAATELPDIILVDLNMPLMNGFEFLQEFQTLDIKNKKQISVIMLTSSPTEKDKQFAKSFGANYFFTKPLTAGLIRNIITLHNSKNTSSLKEIDATHHL